MITHHHPVSQIIILAAGVGTRMRSELPKVLHTVGGKPMIDRVIDNSLQVTDDVILVHSAQILDHLDPYKSSCRLVLQEPANGTAHAVSVALPLIDKTKITAVIFGDNPLITPGLINKLIDQLVITKSALINLAFERDDPAEYGRIITNEAGDFLKIVEFKFASDEEKKITLCNSGIMAFAPGILDKYLPYCLNYNHVGVKELYLTDMVQACQTHAEKVTYLLSTNSHEVVGINTKEELMEANNICNS